MSLAGPRVLCLGMRCAFSTPSLVTLLDAGFNVVGVAVPVPPGADPAIGWRRLAPPGRRAGLTMAHAPEPTVVDVAWARGVPAFEVGRPGHPDALAGLAALAPDVIGVACFPHRLPPAWLDGPPLGCLNVHPSLLPDNRGPEPIFWTFRRGDAETGVTVYRMVSRLDAGPILAQRRLPVPDGITGHELERIGAALGGELLAAALRELTAGTAVPVPQDEARATLHHRPTLADLELPVDRPARWAFNFVRGVATFTGPPFVRLDREPRVVAHAHGYDDAATLDAPFRLDGARLQLRCTPGVLDALVE